MTSIKDKYVLLTGGSRGIGPVIAAALAERGAHLALAARSEQDLQKVAHSLEKYGRQVITVTVDLAQPDEPKRLVARVLEQFGQIDILINNAGLETEGAYLDLPWQDIRTTVEVNLLAPMALTYHVLPHMLERKQGHIVNISSVGAKNGSPYDATYCGTKAGLAEWTRGLRLELAGTGLHFSTIFPGYITEVGMFAKFRVTSPAIIGCCNPKQVARAVVRAIEKEKLELIINSSLATRAVFVISEISPALGDWIFRSAGAVDFQRKKVAGKPSSGSSTG
jgi:short-subunit dehydrogenase